MCRDGIINNAVKKTGNTFRKNMGYQEKHGIPGKTWDTIAGSRKKDGFQK
jgi:hypothetical protein